MITTVVTTTDYWALVCCRLRLIRNHRSRLLPPSCRLFLSVTTATDAAAATPGNRNAVGRVVRPVRPSPNSCPSRLLGFPTQMFVFLIFFRQSPFFSVKSFYSTLCPVFCHSLSGHRHHHHPSLFTRSSFFVWRPLLFTTSIFTWGIRLFVFTRTLSCPLPNVLGLWLLTGGFRRPRVPLFDSLNPIIFSQLLSFSSLCWFIHCWPTFFRITTTRTTIINDFCCVYFPPTLAATDWRVHFYLIIESFKEIFHIWFLKLNLINHDFMQLFLTFLFLSLSQVLSSLQAICIHSTFSCFFCFICFLLWVKCWPRDNLLFLDDLFTLVRLLNHFHICFVFCHCKKKTFFDFFSLELIKEIDNQIHSAFDLWPKENHSCWSHLHLTVSLFVNCHCSGFSYLWVCLLLSFVISNFVHSTVTLMPPPWDRQPLTITSNDHLSSHCFLFQFLFSQKLHLGRSIDFRLVSTHESVQSAAITPSRCKPASVASFSLFISYLHH